MTATTGGRAAPDLSGNVLKTRNWQLLTESQTPEVGIGSAHGRRLQQDSDVRRRTQCLVVVHLRGRSPARADVDVVRYWSIPWHRRAGTWQDAAPWLRRQPKRIGAEMSVSRYEVPVIREDELASEEAPLMIHLAQSVPAFEGPLNEIVGVTRVEWGTRTDNNQEINRDYHFDDD